MSEVGFIKRLKNRTLAEFNQDPKFKISETMSMLSGENIPVDYVVLIIGDKTFSTDHNKCDIARLELVKTKEVGCQNNIRIKGHFHETNGHQKIEAVPFQLNIYTRCGVEEQK